MSSDAPHYPSTSVERIPLSIWNSWFSGENKTEKDRQFFAVHALLVPILKVDADGDTCMLTRMCGCSSFGQYLDHVHDGSISATQEVFFPSPTIHSAFFFISNFSFLFIFFVFLLFSDLSLLFFFNSGFLVDLLCLLVSRLHVQDLRSLLIQLLLALVLLKHLKLPFAGFNGDSVFVTNEHPLRVRICLSLPLPFPFAVFHVSVFSMFSVWFSGLVHLPGSMVGRIRTAPSS
jgi:hypothetical protein